MTPIHFTKMHGLGNDFVIFDSIHQWIKIDAKLIQRIANRNFGIGCDQVLVVEPPCDPTLDFNYRIFNADGEEVEQCGNGARCLGKYVYKYRFTDKTLLKIGTLAGKLTINIADLSQIQVEMGIPQFSFPANTPDFKPLNTKGRYQLTLLGQTREVTLLSLGNPHCIIFVPTTHDANVNEISRALQKHPAFPKGVNVSFVQVLARNHIRCRIFERGAGETLACGSGACAAVISGILQQELNHEVKVDLPGGSLTVVWEGSAVILKGPATSVFEGQFWISSLPETY